MKLVTRQRLLLVITGALVLLAILVIAVFIATGNSAPTAAPTPTRAAGTGTEVLPPTAKPTIAHLGTDEAPLVTAPLPKSASATGKLVAGFPSTVIPIPAGSTISSSAISSQADRMQVTVVATTAATSGDVQAYFQVAFTRQGLAGAAAPSSPGTTTTSFARGTDSITLTTATTTGGTRYTVYALFTAGKS